MNKAEINKLVVRAQNGDRSAFEELYNEFRDRVFFFVKRTTGSDDAAEDITSETFVKALESIGTLREGDIKGTVLAADGRHILFCGEDGELGAVEI